MNKPKQLQPGTILTGTFSVNPTETVYWMILEDNDIDYHSYQLLDCCNGDEFAYWPSDLERMIGNNLRIL